MFLIWYLIQYGVLTWRILFAYCFNINARFNTTFFFMIIISLRDICCFACADNSTQLNPHSSFDIFMGSNFRHLNMMKFQCWCCLSLNLLLLNFFGSGCISMVQWLLLMLLEEADYVVHLPLFEIFEFFILKRLIILNFWPFLLVCWLHYIVTVVGSRGTSCMIAQQRNSALLGKIKTSREVNQVKASERYVPQG